MFFYMMAFRKALEYYSKGLENVKHFFRYFQLFLILFIHRAQSSITVLLVPQAVPQNTSVFAAADKCNREGERQRQNQCYCPKTQRKL
jgi:hypothetical protein